MNFKFRFPIALLDMLKTDNTKMGYQNVLEKAREWAVPLEGQKGRPSLSSADAWLQEVIEDDKKDRERVRERA